jgi:bacillolysin
LRSLINPNDFSNPDTYQGNFWSFVGQSHNNSTVLSHWFYRLSDGGTGINDIGNTFNVNGLGIDVAARITHLTQLSLPVEIGNYENTRATSIQVARDLYGANSCEEAAVTKAWYSVGVGAAYVQPAPFTLVKGYGNDCSSFTASVGWSPTNQSITWVTTNGLLINGNSSPFTVTNSVNEVTISSPNGLAGNITAIKQFNTCNPVSSNTIDFCPCQSWNNATITWLNASPTTNEPLTAIVNPEFPNASYYKWFINGQVVATSVSNMLWTTNWPCTSEGEGLSVVAVTTCGTSELVYGGNYSPICSNSYMKVNSDIKISPNPSTGVFTLTLNSVDRTSFLKAIIIKNKMGMQIYQQKFSNNQKSQTINLNGKPTDIYSVQVFDGKVWTTQKLSLQQ